MVTGLAGEDLRDPQRRLGQSDFAGQVVVLDIWGAWCAPCRAEMLELHALHDEMMAAKEVTVLGVDVRDDRPAARDFLASCLITWFTAGVLAYRAGLGLPFVLLAWGAGRAVRTKGWLRRHIRAVQIAGDVMLLVSRSPSSWPSTATFRPPMLRRCPARA